jgi:hypothetical protein
MYKNPVRALFLIVSQGRPPFKDPNSMTPELRDFIEKCTIMEPKDRPALSTLLKADFFFSKINKLKIIFFF